MAPTGQHLHDLARGLGQRGHEVEVLCSRRSYDGGGDYLAEEVLEGVRVRRVAGFSFGRKGVGRAADYASFLLGAAGKSFVRRQGYDLTVCLTTPPYLGWVVPRALGERAGEVVQWVMDLYPDVLAANGGLSSEGIAYGGLRRLTRGQFGRSALVLALGDRAKERVRAHAPAGVALEVVPLWTGFEAAPRNEVIRSWRERRGWRDEDLVLLYSGNMGLGHRMDEFLEAARRLRGERVVWAFAGGGKRRGEVAAFAESHRDAQVQLLPYVRQSELAASLCAADVHLISLRTPWQGLIVPSKLQAAFGLGRPVLYVGPRDAEPADWILESGGGWVVAEGNVDGVLQAVKSAGDPSERRRRGDAGSAFARRHFDRSANTARIAELLEGTARREMRGM